MRKIITISMSIEDGDKLAKLAKEDMRTKSSLMVKAFKDYTNKIDKSNNNK